MNRIGHCPRCGCFLEAHRVNGDIDYFICNHCGMMI